MKIVNAIIRQQAYEKVSEALAGIGVVGVTVTDCREYPAIAAQENTETDDTGSLKGFYQQIELDVVVRDSRVQDVINLLGSVMDENHFGEGRIYIKKMDDAIRIRDERRGEEVL